MSRPPILSVLAIVLLAVPGTDARADQLNGGVVKPTLKLPDEADATKFITPTAEYLARYFNLARCTCDLGGTAQTFQVWYEWEMGAEPSAPVDQPIEIWTGVGCENANPDIVKANCTKQDPILDPDAITTNMVVKKDYRVGTVLAKPGAVSCEETATKAQVWAVTETSDAIWDADNRDKLDVVFDKQAPPIPTTLTAQPLEGGIQLAWAALTDRADDIQYYQALCAKADGSVALATTALDRRYETTVNLCNAGSAPAIVAATLTNGEGPAVGTLPSALRNLDERYLCGESAGAQARSITMSGLENDQAYWVVLVSVDKAGNVAGVFVDRPITPQPVTDFWEEANNEDGNLQGGFCVSQVGNDGAVGGAVVVALAGLFAARRRRRRCGRLARLALLGLVLAPGVASAQGSFSADWLDGEQGSEIASEPAWTLGFRFGPYRPSVDDNFAKDPGPYARTFLKDSYMFAVDVHRVWSLARGQAGFGLTGGYFTNSALAFVDGTTPETENRPRASGNLTRLSVVPIQLTAIYRATIFDDEMGIPLVPYARAGLGYYLWWAKAPSDELSVAMSCATCSDKAIGGTIGVVAAAGLAIRAERIDGDAARSMQDSGFEHAGFYAEVEGSWISGFGNKTKLSVGDLTWFGGINFEF